MLLHPQVSSAHFVMPAWRMRKRRFLSWVHLYSVKLFRLRILHQEAWIWEGLSLPGTACLKHRWDIVHFIAARFRAGTGGRKKRVGVDLISKVGVLKMKRPAVNKEVMLELG